MAKFLVIVESPAKGRTISKFLGKDYEVLFSMGHLVDLPLSKMGVDIENNFKPQYIVVRYCLPTTCSGRWEALSCQARKKDN